MAAPSEQDQGLDGELIALAGAAAERWDDRTQIREAREAAIQRGDYLEADSPSRLAMRVNHLLQDVRRVARDRRGPSNPLLARLAERPVPITPDELTDELVNEAMIGASNFLSVEFLEGGLRAARSVGRVMVKGGGGLRPWGTGFLVARGLLITNRHVLPSRKFAAACVVEMDFERNLVGAPKRPQTFVLEPTLFFLNDRDLDFALVAVAARSDGGSDIADYGWLPLISSQGKIAITGNDYINVIQHPLGREKEIVIRDNRVLDLRTDGDAAGADIGPFLHYEADTEKGSSGSPVFNDQWEVIALHHSGVPKRDEEGRWLNKEGGLWQRGEQPLSEVAWIANEGIRVSSLVNAVGAAQVQPHERELLDSFLSAQPPTVLGIRSEADEESAGPASAPPAPAGARDGERGAGRARPVVAGGGQGARYFEVPLRIAISLGGTAEPDRVGAEVRTEAIEPEMEALASEDFADRRGYDRQFLGLKVPMPKLKNAPRFGSLLRIARPARPADKFELRYHHHSVLMNGPRRLAYVSACNVDFGAPKTASREEGTGSWRNDPRLNLNQQLGNAYYANNDYDKGHLTRRDDAAWGQTKAEAIAANNDTFFYPNSAPQFFLFNQSDDFTNAGLDLWGDLENFISEQGADQRTRLSIFNGPVFGDNDKKLKDALVPLAFYKIVIWRDGTETPGAVGFVLQQDDLIADLPEEAIDPGRFSIRQQPISAIQDLIDLDFGAVVDWDRMAAADGDEAMGEEEGIPIRSVEDIRL